MHESLALFELSVRTELATRRCAEKCDWCRYCDPREIPAASVKRVLSSPPRPEQALYRIMGGDPFRYADLDRWVGWARQSAAAKVCLEGPASSFGGAIRTQVVERVLRSRPDAVSVVLPSVDAERAAALTGTAWDPEEVFASLVQLRDANIALEVVFPVNRKTLPELARVVTRTAERLGDRVLITLRRAPLAVARTVLPVVDGQRDWVELEGLSEALALLPHELPNGAKLRMDPHDGYAPCMLRKDVRFSGLINPARPGLPQGGRPLSACENCAWSSACTWSSRHGKPPSDQVNPLTFEEAELLQAQSGVLALNHRPTTSRAKQLAFGLPDLLCAAPWTTLSTTDPKHNPVPCAFSWVKTSMSPEECAEETGEAVGEHERQARKAHKGWDGAWYGMENEELSLTDIWNSPLLRRMRREMVAGGASSRCRSMCRVIMGVEERGTQYFLRPDAELPPRVAENRRLLIEEINAGKNVLTAKPLELMVGVSAHCNISCGFCDGPKGTYGELSDRRRDDIITLLPTLMSFGVSGPGEPLMSRNYLALLGHIADVGYPGLSVALTTNGTLLTPEFLERHRNVRWSHVRISLNAGSARTHERMTGKKLFHRVIANLDALCALRDSRSDRMTITLSCVLGSVQMGDLHRFAQIVTDRQADVVVEPMYGDMRGLSPWTRPERLAVLADELSSVADDFVLKNPPLSRAFRAVETFARERLASGETYILAHH